MYPADKKSPTVRRERSSMLRCRLPPPTSTDRRRPALVALFFFCLPRTRRNLFHTFLAPACPSKRSFPAGQAARPLRVLPDGHAGGAGGRQGLHRLGALPGDGAHQHPRPVREVLVLLLLRRASCCRFVCCCAGPGCSGGRPRPRCSRHRLVRPPSLRPSLNPTCSAPIYLGSKEEVELIEQFKAEAGEK